jgi:hypothetical protein
MITEGRAWRGGCPAKTGGDFELHGAQGIRLDVVAWSQEVKCGLKYVISSSTRIAICIG